MGIEVVVMGSTVEGQVAVYPWSGGEKAKQLASGIQEIWLLFIV